MSDDKRTGRPTKSAEPGRRASLGLKVTPDIKARVDAAARVNGRTQSQEAEARLEASFGRQDLLSDAMSLAYGPELAGLLMLIGATMQSAGRQASFMAASTSRLQSASEWFSTPYPYSQAAEAACVILDALQPAGDRSAPNLRLAEVVGSTIDEAEDQLATISASYGKIAGRTAVNAIRGEPSSIPDADTVDRVRRLLGATVDRLGANQNG